LARYVVAKLPAQIRALPSTKHDHVEVALAGAFENTGYRRPEHEVGGRRDRGLQIADDLLQLLLGVVRRHQLADAVGVVADQTRETGGGRVATDVDGLDRRTETFADDAREPK
jgi:hypothetical protein